LSLAADIQQLDVEAPIELFEISGHNTRNPYETKRICNFLGVSFDGEVYEAIPCESSGYSTPSQGAPPMPKLVVSNVGRAVSDWIYLTQNTPGFRLKGSTVTRRTTLKKYLDGQPGQNDAIKEFPRHRYIFERISKMTYLAVEIEQSAPHDLEGVYLPNRLAMADFCSLELGDENCGYVGNIFYDKLGLPTWDTTQAYCGKSLAFCKKYWGATGILPFGGCPGARRQT
jgi:lambda family phage minor tail protein L